VHVAGGGGGINPYRKGVKTHSTFSVPDGCIRPLIGGGLGWFSMKPIGKRVKIKGG